MSEGGRRATRGSGRGIRSRDDTEAFREISMEARSRRKRSLAEVPGPRLPAGSATNLVRAPKRRPVRGRRRRSRSRARLGRKILRIVERRRGSLGQESASESTSGGDASDLDRLSRSIHARGYGDGRGAVPGARSCLRSRFDLRRRSLELSYVAARRPLQDSHDRACSGSLGRRFDNGVLCQPTRRGMDIDRRRIHPSTPPAHHRRENPCRAYPR